LKDFVINYKQQKHKAILLYGPVGVGKTSSVYALANELKYDLLESNSSDVRNADGMKSFLSSALGQQSLFFTPKMILLDEIDNISGVKDRGCIPTLVKAIEKSTFPVILTANDPFDQKFKSLRKVCQMVEYQTLDHATISHTLKWVSEQENIVFEEKAINSLSRQVAGDMRAALIDLQSCAAKGSIVFDDVTNLSDRKRTDSILKALAIIFKSSSAENALHALDTIDVDIRDVFFWMDNNLPKEYLTPSALARAYEHLSRADVFNGRIRRWQHWRFLVYISNLLTAGISTAKDEKNPDFVQYKPTMRFLRMWQAKMKNAKKKDIASKYAERTHVSMKVALEQVPYLKEIASRDSSVATELELNDDEVGWLKK